MSYEEVRRLPVRYRTWFLNRLKRYYDERIEKPDKEPANSNRSQLDKYQETLQKKFNV